MGIPKAFAQTVAKGFKKHWPKVAVGAGAGLLFVGGFLLGTEVPRYKKVIEEKEEEKGEKLTTGEKVKTAVKHFAGPASAVIVGTGLILAGTRENDKRIAVGTTAAALSEVASKNLATYTEAAKEVVGEEKEKEIQNKVKEKKLATSLNPPDNALPNEKSWCYELVFNDETPFAISYNDLVTIERNAEKRLNRKGYGSAITLNEVFEEMGRAPAKAGEAFGWIYDDDPSHRSINFNIETMIRDGHPVLTICPNVLIIDRSYFEVTDFRY